jgi:hypothetical protein
MLSCATPPRVRWVSYVDALMLPLDNAAEAATSRDLEKLFPLEDRLLQRYLADLNPGQTIQGVRIEHPFG